jgi:uracil-DNA glycosylase
MTELEALRIQAEACTVCRLSETRTNVVFGVGSADADLMFVGEAPGRNEDLRGEPFVGRAGMLLDQLLAEVGIPRETVYIANVLKCRPPNNRDPQPDEIEACKGYLRRQIELIRPRVVVTLGNFATKLLLRTSMGITRTRGRSYPWWLDSTLIPTFHPAAALRGGDRVTDAMRQDFSLMKEALDTPRGSATPASVEPASDVDAGAAAEGGEPVQERLWS